MGVTGAEALNEKWDALSARFDLLKTVPKDQARLINAAISDWQDWYWDKYESWPSADLLRWQERYLKTAALLDAVAKKTVVVKTVQQTDSYVPPKPVPVKLPPLLVTARPPAPPPPELVLGPVDTSGWGKATYAPLTTYSRAVDGPSWTPTGSGLKPNRKGLAALLIAVGGAIMGHRTGVL